MKARAGNRFRSRPEFSTVTEASKFVLVTVR